MMIPQTPPLPCTLIDWHGKPIDDADRHADQSVTYTDCPIVGWADDSPGPDVFPVVFVPELGFAVVAVTGGYELHDIGRAQ